MSKEYAFVDEFAKLESQVNSPGHRERMEYWLANFRYVRAAAQTNCTWARFNDAMAKVGAEKDAAKRKQLARETALPIRKELIAQATETQRYLMATITNPGEMGMVTNWQQHNIPGLITQPGAALAQILGEKLPADAMPAKDYAGPPRLFVPVVRTALVSGEELALSVIILGAAPSDAAVWWRPLGSGEFAKTPLVHVARGVYKVTLPREATQTDLEYYVQATVGNSLLRFPATAPTMNQSVVVVKGE